MATEPGSRPKAKASGHGGAVAPSSSGGGLGFIGTVGKTIGKAAVALTKVDLSDAGLIAAPLYQMSPNPSQHGYIAPGVKAVAGSTWQVGTLRPYNKSFSGDTTTSTSVKPSNYAFRFHYNPSSIQITTQTVFDYTPATDDPSLPLTAAPGTISFQILINRSEDVYDRRVLPRSPSTYPFLGCTNIAELGTQYDIEWLFRVFNGVRNDVGKNGNKVDSKIASADIGLLLPNPVQLKFGNGISYPCYGGSLSINHLKFTPSMVPLVSTVDIALARFTDAVLPKDTAT